MCADPKDDIEITPEMIEAGRRFLRHHNPRETSDIEDEEIVASIFREMLTVARISPVADDPKLGRAISKGVEP